VKRNAQKKKKKNRYKRIEDRIEDRQYTLYTARGMILIYGKPPQGRYLLTFFFHFDCLLLLGLYADVSYYIRRLYRANTIVSPGVAGPLEHVSHDCVL
jgi:hypothetical protein